MCRLASLLAAALLDGLSEQPAGHSASVSDLRRGVVSGVVISFVNKLLDGLFEHPSVADSLCPRHVTLARIIHEHFCCNRGFAAATSLRRAGSPKAPSTYC